MIMNWPQLTYLALIGIGLGIALAKDGEPRDGKHNFIAFIIVHAITLYILYAGGFFG